MITVQCDLKGREGEPSIELEFETMDELEEFGEVNCTYYEVVDHDADAQSNVDDMELYEAEKLNSLDYEV